MILVLRSKLAGFGQSVSVKDTWPEDITKTWMRHATVVYWKTWAKKHETEELKRGVYWEPNKTFLKDITIEAGRQWSVVSEESV